MKMERKHTARARAWMNGLLSPLALGGVAIVLAACDLGVQNPGAILDEDLNTPELMPVMVNGVSSEFNDVMDDLAFDIARLTDEVAGSGSYFDTGRFRRGVFDDEDSETHFEQIHEAIWSADNAWQRMQDVLGANARGELSARLFLLEGLSHRALGENFCQVTYGISALLPRTAAFDSAIVALTTAIEHAGTLPAAANFKTAATAGLAQAYVGLGQWDKAVAEASKVPTNFVLAAPFNVAADNNEISTETYGRAEISVLGTLAARFDPAQDVRARFTKCGVYTDPNDPSKGVTRTNAPGCTSFRGNDGLSPHWRQDKYPDVGSDIPIVKGTEMRLIEAEAALRNNDLVTFTAKINAVRSHHGLTPIAQPATAGALEYPNALNDAWSILDAERWLTLWLEGRRMWDLFRWNHPFLNGGTVIYPAEPRRAWCMPIPAIECQLNQNLRGTTLQTSTGGTSTCA